MLKSLVLWLATSFIIVSSQERELVIKSCSIETESCHLIYGTPCCEGFYCDHKIAGGRPLCVTGQPPPGYGRFALHVDPPQLEKEMMKKLKKSSERMMAKMKREARASERFDKFVKRMLCWGLALLLALPIYFYRRRHTLH